ncbi:MAG: 2-oxo acid dehydrogenase subunit E2 [Myxococcales bacterium]|nr:2-oxo acid dehydrogenase subunit E2 [Myxococcales bacterium]
MVFSFKLPDIGEGVVEGELVKWLVQPGQAVREDTPLFEVLTDKTTAVIPSPRAGSVRELHFAEGAMVPVGAVVVTLDTAETAAASAVPAAVAVAPAALAKAPAAAAPGPVPPTAPVSPTAAESAAAPAELPEHVRAAPATRKLARELGVDIRAVSGTGDHGRITRQDVEQWAARLTAAPAPPVPGLRSLAPTRLEAGPDEERLKLKGLRRRIAQKMRESKDHAAHFTYVEEIDFTAIVALKDALARHGLLLTYLPFVMKAVVLSLRKPEFSYLNAQLDDAAGEIVVKKRYHIGVAAATDPGLLVPVVRDVDRLNLRELAAEVKRLAEGARAGTLPSEDLQGSTFTITSLGKLGGMFATPIINHPESAILGLHKVEKRPVVVDGAIVIRDRMYMSCSFDHRLIDGHVGAAFVQDVKAFLEEPALLMAALA